MVEQKRTSSRTDRLMHGLSLLLLLALSFSSTGCSWRYMRPRPSHSQGFGLINQAPTELKKGILPEYRIEPPDVITVTAIRLVPKTPYRLKIGDTVVIEVIGTVPDAPISGIYPIQIGGVINLGFSYGQVAVRGMTVEEARDAIYNHLLDHLRDPQVTVSLGNIAASQQITGPRPVGQDGRINLGAYGTVSVVGKTVVEAKAAIEEHLTDFLDEPEVSVDVQTVNSKFYYIITQGAGLGDRVARVPMTGNETVLDAIAGLGGFNQQSTNKIWISRPGTNRKGHCQIMRVDWRAITQLGETDTNYQILPGDRLYIAENKWIRFDNDLQIIVRPFFTMGQFTNFMLATIRNLNAGISGQAANAFQNVGTGVGGGFGGVIPPNPITGLQ